MSDDEHPPFDLARIVEVLNRHGVSYIAIGRVSGMLTVLFTTSPKTST